MRLTAAPLYSLRVQRWPAHIPYIRTRVLDFRRKMSSTSLNGAQKPVEVLLVGLGSIGSIYAYLLEKTGRARVTAVARSNYGLYTEKGVTLDTEKYGKIEGWRPHRVVKSQAEAFEGDSHYDFCFVTTKCLPDVTPTPELLKDAIASRKIGAWTLLQNGIGVEEDLYQAVEHLNTPVLSNLAWVGMMTSPDGSVVSWKGWECLVSGIYPPAASVPGETKDRAFSTREKEALQLWTGLLRDGGATVKTTDYVEAVRFSKNVWNCGWSSIQGLTRTRPASYANLPQEVTQPLRDFMREIVDVGFGSGLLKEGMIQYPMEQPMGTAEEVASVAWTKILETSLAAAKTGGGHKMSLWVDVEMGRPIEVEVIVGGVVRLARKHGIKTPLLDYTYALLKGLQTDLLSRR